MVSAIGGLERVLYIYSTMIGHYELVAGWLIMKGFFGWTTQRDLSRADNETIFDHYYSYIWGNLVSLLIGILMGNLAMHFAKYLAEHLAS